MVLKCSIRSNSEDLRGKSGHVENLSLPHKPGIGAAFQLSWTLDVFAFMTVHDCPDNNINIPYCKLNHILKILF